MCQWITLWWATYYYLLESNHFKFLFHGRMCVYSHWRIRGSWGQRGRQLKVYHSNHQIIVTRVMHEDSRISWHGLILYSAVWWCVRLWLTGKPHSYVGLGMRLYTAHCGSEIASFPGSHTSEYKHGSCPGVESLLSFLTWPWHNRNRTRVFRTERQCFARCSTNYAFDVRCVWYLPPNSWISVVSFPLTLHFFFMFYAFGYAHTQLGSSYCFYLWRCSCEKKYQALHARKT